MYGEEKMTPRMSASDVMGASTIGTPNTANQAAQSEFDSRVAGAKLQVAGTKQVIKGIGKSVAGPVGGLIGSAVANKLYKD
jgi:hypothetical protein